MYATTPVRSIQEHAQSCAHTCTPPPVVLTQPHSQTLTQPHFQALTQPHSQTTFPNLDPASFPSLHTRLLLSKQLLNVTEDSPPCTHHLPSLDCLTSVCSDCLKCRHCSFAPDTICLLHLVDSLALSYLVRSPLSHSVDPSVWS